MTSLGPRIALAAVLAGGAANLAAADTLTFAEGTHEGEKVRIVAGDVDDRGVLYAEYYQGAGLRFAAPFEKAFVDGEETSIRSLRELSVGQQTSRGFTFTALQGGTQITCTALLWGDSTATCTRDPAWKPAGSPECAAAFDSNTERFQCNGLRRIFASPVIGHDELLRACSSAFRWESYRTECLRYGYNVPANFHDKLAACVDAYRSEHERKFCIFYSFAPAREQDRMPPEIVRACDRLHDDDKATTDCAFEKLTGAKQVKPKQGPPLPTDHPTQPLARTTPNTPASGDVDVVAGALRELSVRAIGGMLGAEPVLWVDAYTATGALKWMNPIDRIVIGKQVRALREVTALERLKLQGDILTFRVEHGGKKLACRADVITTWAKCK